jgi:hypothetical protein
MRHLHACARAFVCLPAAAAAAAAAWSLQASIERAKAFGVIYCRSNWRALHACGRVYFVFLWPSLLRPECLARCANMCE